MFKDTRPVLSALLRNRTGAVLVALQVALALAVLVNAIYIVKQRVELVGRPTGLDIENITVVVSTGFAADYDHMATMREDLLWLRRLPDVVAATVSNAIPLSGGGSSSSFSAAPDTKTDQTVPMNTFKMDEASIDALGVKLVAGRAFRAEDILPPEQNSSRPIPEGIITRDVARQLYGTEDAVGKVFYNGLNEATTVVGVIDHMHGSWVTWSKVGNVALAPVLPNGPQVVYLVRTKPGMRDAIAKQIEEHLSESNPARVIRHVRPLDFYRDRSYLADRNMAIFLVAVTALLACITALGIFALATFNVNVRTRQIGTRRAVGARRADIVRYFLVENWLVTTGGVLLGSALALAVGYWLSRQYELPRLDLYFLTGGVVGLWLLGLAAAWQPARRASRIAPSVATRTV